MLAACWAVQAQELLACESHAARAALIDARAPSAVGVKHLLQELGRVPRAPGTDGVEVECSHSALRWAAERGVPLEAIHYNTLIMTCGRAGRWREALEVFQAMKTGGSSPGASGAPSGEGDGLGESCAAAPVRPNVFTYNVLISALSRNRQYAAALALFDEMTDAGVQADLITFSTAIKACEQGGKWEHAMRAFAQMKAVGVRPDIVTYNTLLQACEKAGQLEPAMDVFAELAESSAAPDVVTYNTLISACERSRDAALATRLVEQMRNAGVEPDQGTYATLVAVHEKAGQWRQARAVVASMRRAGVQPTLGIYACLIGLYQRAGQAKLAVAAYRQLRQEGLQPNPITFSSLISVCEKGGQWEMALALFDDMRALGVPPDTVTFSAAISACQKGGQWERALELLEEMPRCGVTPNAVTYNATILSCRDRWDEARAVFAQMRSAGVAPTVYTYTALLTACAAAAKWEDALALLDEMEAEGASVAPNTVMYNALISAFEKDKEAGPVQLDRALAVYERMQAADVAPDAITFSALITVCLRAGEWQRGLHFLQHMRMRHLQPNDATYNPLLNALWNSGDRRLAVQIYQQALVDGAYADNLTRRPPHDVAVQDMHNMSAGAAQAKMVLWLLGLKLQVESPTPGHLPEAYTVITGWGRHSKQTGSSEVKEAITAWLDGLDAPFSQSPDNPGRLVTDSVTLTSWLKATSEEDLVGSQPRSIFDLSGS